MIYIVSELVSPLAPRPPPHHSPVEQVSKPVLDQRGNVGDCLRGIQRDGSGAAPTGSLDALIDDVLQ